MNRLKKILGILWMLIGPIVFILLTISAVHNINSATKGDISNPIPWIIILVIFAPIAVGLTIFGWYSWKGEYDDHKL
jgi:ABC-type polysaccharide/polyol phosphate export permease